MAKKQLQKRELALIIGGVLFLTGLILYSVLQGQFRSFEQVEAQRASAEQALITAKVIQEQVKEGQKGRQLLQERAQVRGAGYDLLAVVQGALDRANLKSDRASTQDNKAGVASLQDFYVVETNVEGVSVQEVVDLLHNLYTADTLIQLSGLTLTPGKQGKGLDCRMTLLSPKLRA